MLLCIIASTSSVIAQSVNDFDKAVEAAKSGKGCESLPYPSMKSRCIDLNSIKKSNCINDNTDWNEMDPRKLQNTIDNINRNIANLMQKK
jgi:hypothetical protein